jgi:hypothetical protein
MLLLEAIFLVLFIHEFLFFLEDLEVYYTLADTQYSKSFDIHKVKLFCLVLYIS